MKNLLFRFYLLFVILLTSGYSNAYGYTHKATISSSSVKVLAGLNAEDSKALEINRDFISSSRFNQTLNEKLTIENTDTEDEKELEEDLDKEKENTVVVKGNFAIFYTAQTPEFLNYPIYKCLQSCKHFFYSSTRKKHIVFRVLRI